MLYFANPSTPRVRDAMRAGRLAMIDTPKQRNIHPEGVTWCADNGCFGSGYPGDEKWFAWLGSFTPAQVARCKFAVAPDVVGDARGTHRRSAPWLPRIRDLGYPVAYVAQNGLENLPVPWPDLDALFIGGDTAWKMGRHARALIAEAKAHGKWVHMGRVNSLRRMRYAEAIGCDSADGTHITFSPDGNLPVVLGWLRGVNDQLVLDLGRNPW